jgi:GNAT superfamily N-acetyltransferase
MDTSTAEIKRMYVMPNHRGMGAGRAILEKLEQVARELGVVRIVLEAGERQPEALALYGHCGYRKIPLFGEYVASPLSVCMEKPLAPAK